MNAQFTYLKSEPAPRHLVEAVNLLGVTETQGKENNPIILGWAKELQLKDYNADSIPWCGLFVAIVVKRANRIPIGNPLWARNWAKWGEAVSAAMLGDILVFSRGDFGHVGIYVGEDTSRYHVLGGNQGDAVSIVPILKARCIAVRRPAYINQPQNIRSIFINSNAKASTNEG
jgi:uncharacterized protein (TIGR02594 family)